MPAKAAGRAARAAQRKSLAERTVLMRDTRDRIVALLKHALEEIRQTLAAAPTDYELWNLPRLADEIRRELETFGEKAAGEISTAAGKSWGLGEGSVARTIAAAEPAAAGILAQLPRLDTRQLRAMRAFMVDRIKDVGRQAAARVTNELGLVVVGAQGPSAAISHVTQILGEPSRRRATTIVRTELGRVFAVAAHERLLQAAEKVPGMKKQWRQSGKLHPRLHHVLADGQVQEVGKPFILAGGKVKLMYPHDPRAPAGETINCGCVSLPYKAEWAVRRPGRVPGNPIEEG